MLPAKLSPSLLLAAFVASVFFSAVDTSYANNAGTNRQSCKKGYVWHYKDRKCILKADAPKKNKPVWTGND